MFDMIEWFIMRNQPLSEIDNEITRRLLNRKVICSKSIPKYILNLNAIVEKKVTSEIPDRFVIIFEGWTECHTHFVANFATCNVNGRFHETLTGLAPLLKEDDLGADQLFEFIKANLAFFGKSLENVVAFIDDNSPVNKKVSTDSGIPLIGCSSHKLNRAVEQWVEEDVDVKEALNVVNDLMVQLRKLENAAKLRKLTRLGAIDPNETR